MVRSGLRRESSVAFDIGHEAALPPPPGLPPAGTRPDPPPIMPEADPEGPLPMVLLRHTTPDGSSHFDWLLGRCSVEEAGRSPDTRDAVTLRLNAPPDFRGADRLDAQRLPDHRRLYLWFEGELSEGGGRVERVAIGQWWGLETDPIGRHDAQRFRARFEGEPQATRWELAPDGLTRIQP